MQSNLKPTHYRFEHISKTKTGRALHAATYNSARGWLTNKQGRQIEITLGDNNELERILSEGLDFHNLHLHVEFEELESSRITITAGNVPVEAGDMLITEVIEAHGGKIERDAYVTQEYRGNQVQAGRRCYHTTKPKPFQPLPKVVRLLEGRYISFRPSGQPVTEDVWEVNDTPSARNHRSYPSVLTEQPSCQTDHTAYQEDVGETYQQTSPQNQTDPAQPPGPAPPSNPAPPAKPVPPSEPSPPAQPHPPAQPSQPSQLLESTALILQPTNDSIHQYLEFDMRQQWIGRRPPPPHYLPMSKGSPCHISNGYRRTYDNKIHEYKINTSTSGTPASPKSTT